jgi:hypothetical protein
MKLNIFTIIICIISLIITFIKPSPNKKIKYVYKTVEVVKTNYTYVTNDVTGTKIRIVYYCTINKRYIDKYEYSTNNTYYIYHTPCKLIFGINAPPKELIDEMKKRGKL